MKKFIAFFSEISSVLTACSIFIPGISNNTSMTCKKSWTNTSDDGFGIRRWETKSITYDDIAKYKLIGLSKKVKIPKHIKRLVSILDYEEAILNAPTYKGEILNEIFNTKKKWPVRFFHISKYGNHFF